MLINYSCVVQPLHGQTGVVITHAWLVSITHASDSCMTRRYDSCIWVMQDSCFMPITHANDSCQWFIHDLCQWPMHDLCMAWAVFRLCRVEGWCHDSCFTPAQLSDQVLLVAGWMKAWCELFWLRRRSHRFSTLQSRQIRHGCFTLLT